MKRKLNRIRKEQQVGLHKVNLVSWVVHGNFVNRKLNNTNLMASALKLLPKNDNHCYPKDQTDIDYFQQITKWFKSEIKLRNTSMYCMLKQRPPIMMSLGLQMKFKAAICRRDYVLIFLVLLRAIGVQCRMVQSLVCAPILPPKSELLSLAAKKKSDESKDTSKISKSSSSSKSKNSSASTSKSSSSSHSKSADKIKSPEKSARSSRSKTKNPSEPPTIPQLDGGDDEASASKSKKQLKIKIRPGKKEEEVEKEDNPQTTTRKSSLKPTTPSVTRSSSRSPAVSKMTPKVRFSLTPNRNSPSPSDKLFKSNPSKRTVAKLKDDEKMFSPLKTRRMRMDSQPSAEPKASTSKAIMNGNGSKSKKVQPESSKKVANKSVKDKAAPKMDTLKVFSPPRTRSRSRSNDSTSPAQADSTAKKPNLKNLQKDRKRPKSPEEKVVAKKAKVNASGSKRSAAEDVSESQKKKSKPNGKKVVKDKETEADSDDSAKLFREPTKKKKFVVKKIDRRVLSSDSEPEAASSFVSADPFIYSPRKSKGIDIWVEVYSEKDQRWISIDVFRGKVDNVKEIVKTATHPVTYVFAWNNDNSLKDISARYCANLNTTVRKMRVDAKYMNSVVAQYAGIKTSRDIKEDNELNVLQLAKPMPTTISE